MDIQVFLYFRVFPLEKIALLSSKCRPSSFTIYLTKYSMNLWFINTVVSGWLSVYNDLSCVWERVIPFSARFGFVLYVCMYVCTERLKRVKILLSAHFNSQVISLR